MPDLARVVPRLRPGVLHRVIDHCGLEDCSEIVALATPAQLAQVFDLDVWRPALPGRDEQFSAARFGTWLEVLLESGADNAAGMLAAMPPEPLIAGFAHYVRVFDYISIVTHETTDGSWYCHRSTEDEFACDIGGYRVMAKSPDTWDAIVAILTSLASGQPDAFHRIMSGVRAQSNAGWEVNGLDNLLETEEQAMFDLSSDRDQRREQQGYATPAEARGSLEMARHSRVDGTAADPGCDLRASGRLVRMRSHMRHLFEREPAIYEARSAELAWLANTLIAGCSIQSRAFTPQEASAAAVAICNLGLEYTPDLPDDHLIRQDLMGVFQIGWTMLHHEVAMFTASQLIDTLTRFRIADREIQSELNFLRIEMAKQWRAGTPWRARRLLETVAMLDLPAWAALAALIAECPVRHAALQARESRALRIEMSRFEWISDGSDLAAVRTFMQDLPETLGLETSS